MQLVEVVVVRDLYRQTVGVLGLQSSVTTLGGLATPRVLGLGCQGDVMVNELTPGHQKDRHSMVVESLVFVHGAGDDPSRGQGVAGDGSSRCRDAVSVVRSQPPVVSVHSGSPVGVLQVVTYSLRASISLDLALRCHQERRAVWLNDCLGCVNQR